MRFAVAAQGDAGIGVDPDEMGADSCPTSTFPDPNPAVGPTPVIAEIAVKWSRRLARWR